MPCIPRYQRERTLTLGHKPSAMNGRSTVARGHNMPTLAHRASRAASAALEGVYAHASTLVLKGRDRACHIIHTPKKSAPHRNEREANGCATSYRVLLVIQPLCSSAWSSAAFEGVRSSTLSNCCVA